MWLVWRKATGVFKVRPVAERFQKPLCWDIVWGLPCFE